MVTSGCWNSVHEPVVKSSRRLPDRQHHVGGAGEVVRRLTTGHTDRPAIERMRGDEAGLARDGLDHRDVVALGEGEQLGLGEGVVDTAAGEDQRLRSRPQRRHRSSELPSIGPGPHDRVMPRCQELIRDVEGQRLHVLGQPDQRRAAVGGVEHRVDRQRERREDLVGHRDPIPVARHRPERIVHRGRGHAEVLDLLQNRIGRARRERVAGEQQQRDPVRVRHAGRGDHVRRARSDRRGRRHDLTAAHGLAVGRRGECHALLVLAAPRRQLVPAFFERVAETGDVAVAEDPVDAGEQWRGGAVAEFCRLGNQMGDDRLGDGHASSAHSRTTSSHCSDFQLFNNAACTLT